MKVGLSDIARQMLSNEIYNSCPIMHFSELYYFNAGIHEKGENDQCQ